MVIPPPMIRIGSLFTGAGGLDLGLRSVLPPSELAFVSDIPAYDKRVRMIGNAPAILAHHHPETPNLGDITRVNWATAPAVDVIVGGSPCQDLSTAGARAGMHSGTRSGLWVSMAEAIRQLQPALVIWENVNAARSASAHSDVEHCPGCMGDHAGIPAMRALGRVLGDLASLGVDAQWRTLRASDIGAPHRRERVFIVAAHPHRYRRLRRGLPPESWPHHTTARPAGLRVDQLLPTPTTQPSTGNGHARHLTGELMPTPRGHDGLATPGSPGAARHVAKGFGSLPETLGLLSGLERYADAIERWAGVVGRPAPAPLLRGRGTCLRLNPAFSEWMMGLPEGHVTDVPGLNITQQLHAIGNGVVPLQAAAAIRECLAALG